ncbi:GntR family transcriptional regulator [Lysinibacillus pakistanensis]|uniref:GntR family transcriptional regulator n=2 Tax=Lysinibacillus pakistanensis TaxID=759811 RepID=A0ABX6DFE0_9BACI|nr:GntR family transcriptional regulator [Lysinibacillus pakistanensis]QGG53538.1 GntR family transcriptional regulator [Lysinibacillus pakistanensis]WHY46391.1 GntR family transcriptional regulator [Lysinibacillus pakistanensis]
MMEQFDTKKKLKRTFVREEAYTIIRDWIVDGTLKPNQQLRDKELAEQLGVSRTPIREALLRLEDEGFVQTKPNRSTTVSPIDATEVFHLYSIGWTLEQLAMKQIFEHLADDHLQKMETINLKLKKAITEGNQIEAVEYDNEFHEIFIELSQNKELKRILTGVRQKLKRVELYYFDLVEDVHFSYEEHLRIIEAIRQKDLSVVLNEIEQNWKLSFARIQNRLIG